MKTLLQFLTIFLLTAQLFAQQNDSVFVNQIINDLNSFWGKYHYHSPINNDSSDITETKNFIAQPSHIANAGAKNLTGLIDENKLKAEILRKDWGLKFATGYLENFNPSFNDDDNLIYNRRVQAGVNWDILHSGYFENKTLAKVQEIENLILQSALLTGNKNENLTVKWNEIIYLFNLQKIKLLEERALLIEKQNEAAQKLFLSKYITKETYLENEKRLAEIKSMNKIYVDFNEQLKGIGIHPKDEFVFPLIDIRYEILFTQTELNTIQNDTLLELIREKNLLQSKWINQVNLGTFLRYNYYDLITTSPGSRAFMSAGINLSLPITFSKETQKKYIEVKSQNEYQKLLKQDDSQQANMLDDAYEFRYKLKQYVVFYHKKQLFEEILRKENARRTIDPLSFNPFKILSMQDDILSIDMELVELKQTMYLKLLKILSRKQNLQVHNTITPLVLPDKIEYINPIFKSIYVWSSAFEQYDPSFIAEYVRFHDIKKAAISFGNKKETQSAIISGIQQLKQNNVEIEFLIGDNDFADKKLETYFEGKNLDLALLNWIHIDYEPHTKPDWNEKKNNYLSNFFQKLQEARAFCDANKLKLVIAIPLHYPENEVKEYLKLCDQVCFMAYENVKTSYISNKLTPYENNKAKISIALRTNDFEGRAQMETTINELSKLTGITSYYLHDLKRCVEWDENAVDKK